MHVPSTPLVQLSVDRLAPWLDDGSAFMQAALALPNAGRNFWASRFLGLAKAARQGKLSAGVTMDVLRDVLTVARADEFPSRRWHCCEPTQFQRDRLADAFTTAAATLRTAAAAGAAAPREDFFS